MQNTITSAHSLVVDSSVPLTHHDPRDLGLICLDCKETQNPFSDSFGFENPILDFLTETAHPNSRKRLVA